MPEFYQPTLPLKSGFFRVVLMATESLTAEVAQFIVSTKSRRIPPEVMHLGKRSILDGIGLALAGNAADSGRIVRS